MSRQKKTFQLFFVWGSAAEYFDTFTPQTNVWKCGNGNALAVSCAIDGLVFAMENGSFLPLCSPN